MNEINVKEKAKVYIVTGVDQFAETVKDMAAEANIVASSNRPMFVKFLIGK